MYGMLRSSPFTRAAITSMDISTFITRHMEQILAEWEEFATSFGAVADKMTSHELRDHAQQILEFVAADICEEESADDAEHKSRGHHAADDDSASSLHGRLRYASGFTLLQLIAEYRALRASVLKLWQQDGVALTRHSAQDIVRFNEAIDQSLADAAVAYSDKVNETRDMFLAILGHDLRSPLAATATAGVYLARPGVFDERVTQIGVRLKRSAATMNGMVNDLLGLARTQLGDGIPIERRACDLRETAAWAIEDAQAAHPRAIFAFDASGDVTGRFDGPRLQQLLTNLTTNAAQYGKPGAPIAVDIVGEEDRVLLKVSNQGAVIPDELLPTLFSSLVQLPAKEGDQRPRSSLGLGLYIACQIAGAHGGTIDVVSDAQSGTVFTVAIPRH